MPRIQPKPLPPLEKLDMILSYNPATGLFTKLKSGKPTGDRVRPADNRYIIITIGGRSFAAHRLAWYLFHRRPIREGYEIDHFNGDKGDNRIENLRELNGAQNMKSAKSGYSLRFFRDGRIE
jgi:hypothetical protein